MGPSEGKSRVRKPRQPVGAPWTTPPKAHGYILDMIAKPLTPLPPALVVRQKCQGCPETEHFSMAPVAGDHLCDGGPAVLPPAGSTSVERL